MSLTLLVTKLNTKIRMCGLSSREMLTQRDQFTNNQLRLDDFEMIMDKHNKAIKNHQPSSTNKAPGKGPRLNVNFTKGDLVFIYGDRSKNHPRNCYIVMNTTGETYQMRNLVGSQLRSQLTTVHNMRYIQLVARYRLPNQ